MADRGWKAFERRLARRFGTARIPAAGALGAKQLNMPDFISERLSAQVKKGYQPPTYLRAWLKGIQETAAEGTIPVVIWAGKGVRDDDALVFLRVSDLERLLSVNNP